MSFPGDAISHDERDPTPPELQPLLAAVLEANSMWERQRDVADLADFYEKVGVLWVAARDYYRIAQMDNDSAGINDASRGGRDGG